MAELAACQDVVWHEITLMRPGRYRGSDLGTPPHPPHTSRRLMRPAHNDLHCHHPCWLTASQVYRRRVKDPNRRGLPKNLAST